MKLAEARRLAHVVAEVLPLMQGPQIQGDVLRDPVKNRLFDR
jgi:hypothetical protein